MRFRKTAPWPVLWVILVLAVLWSALQSWSDIATRAVWFHLTGDEALHSELIEVLVRTGMYQQWSGPAFAPVLTTGPALIIPSTLLKAVFGLPAAVSGRLVSFFYYVGACVSVVYLARWRFPAFTRFNVLLFTLATLGIFHIQWRALADNFYYPYAVLGEQAMIFWLCVAVAAQWKSRPYWAGCAAGLALLSKPYVVFLVPVWFLALALRKPRLSAFRFLGRVLIRS